MYSSGINDRQTAFCVQARSSWQQQQTARPGIWRNHELSSELYYAAHAEKGALVPFHAFVPFHFFSEPCYSIGYGSVAHASLLLPPVLFGFSDAYKVCFAFFLDELPNTDDQLTAAEIAQVCTRRSTVIRNPTDERLTNRSVSPL